MKTCPKCSHESSEHAGTCSRCGTALGVQNTSSCAGDAAQLLGRVVNDKYEVLSVLGVGGMGVVYKVRHLILQRRNLFALKILHPKISNDEHFRTRFLREVEVAMELTHENIIQIRDFGLTEENQLFFTMDYFRGQSLRALIRKEYRIPQDRAVGILRQLLKAMCEAYRQGIVHRDLKPDNILVERIAEGEDEVKILDFGIAKMLDAGDGSDQQTTRGGILGSPKYMSPEQVTGDPVDHRSDLYSLGIIFFEMLTGKPPFAAKTARAMLTQHLSARVPSLEKACPGIQIASQLENLLQRLVAKDPNNRPPTSYDVLDVLDGASTLVLPVSRRRGGSFIKTVALVAMGVLAFGLSWILDPSWSEHLGWASKWVEAAGESSSAGDSPSTTGSGADPTAPVRLRCQLCGVTFADGELSGNTHHDLPLERL